MSKNGPQPHVDELAATLQLIQMILLFARGRNQITPITIQAKKNAFSLLGLKSEQTGDKSIYWKFPFNLQMFLQRAGLDPITGVLLDHNKFELALRELSLEHAALLEAKYINQDYNQRTDAVRKVLQTYRPTEPPKSTTPSQFLANYALNRQIVHHIRQSDDPNL